MLTLLNLTNVTVLLVEFLNVFEFKELLLELAIRLKDSIDSAPGKLRSLMKKFLDDCLLKRLTPYIKFNLDKKENSA